MTISHTAEKCYLMCEPKFFDVTYSINPWMNPELPTDAGRAVNQWNALRNALAGLGHVVELMDPLPGQPDMVFTANVAAVSKQRAMTSVFAHQVRQPEADACAKWLSEHDFEISKPRFASEGQGDVLIVPGQEIAIGGHGFRTDLRAHSEMAEWLNIEILPVKLIDPWFYHLDTALSILTQDVAIYYPPAFDKPSQRLIAELFHHSIEVEEPDAMELGVNAISDGVNVIMDQGAASLQRVLAQTSFNTIPLDLSELKKSGGSARCCVLELFP